MCLNELGALEVCVHECESEAKARSNMHIASKQTTRYLCTCLEMILCDGYH